MEFYEVFILWFRYTWAIHLYVALGVSNTTITQIDQAQMPMCMYMCVQLFEACPD